MVEQEDHVGREPRQHEALPQPGRSTTVTRTPSASDGTVSVRWKENSPLGWRWRRSRTVNVTTDRSSPTRSGRVTSVTSWVSASNRVGDADGPRAEHRVLHSVTSPGPRWPTSLSRRTSTGQGRRGSTSTTSDTAALLTVNHVGIPVPPSRVRNGGAG